MDVRFVGLAKPSDGSNKERIESLTGLTLHRNGDDWIVQGNDPALLKGPPDVLRTLDEPWELAAASYKRIAEEYAEKVRMEPPKPAKCTVEVHWTAFGVERARKRLGTMHPRTDADPLHVIKPGCTPGRCQSLDVERDHWCVVRTVY